MKTKNVAIYLFPERLAQILYNVLVGGVEQHNTF